MHDWVLTERKKRRFLLGEVVTFSCTKCPEKWTQVMYCEPAIYSANDPRFKPVAT